MNLVLRHKLGEFPSKFSCPISVIFLLHRFRSSKQSGSSGSSSIGIIRTDSSDVFDGNDGMIFDGDSRGSSVSLNSTCSARSHQEPNGVHVDDGNANSSWLHGQDAFDAGSNVLNFSPQLQRRYEFLNFKNTLQFYFFLEPVQCQFQDFRAQIKRFEIQGNVKSQARVLVVGR